MRQAQSLGKTVSSKPSSWNHVACQPGRNHLKSHFHGCSNHSTFEGARPNSPCAHGGGGVGFVGDTPKSLSLAASGAKCRVPKALFLFPFCPDSNFL